MAAPNSERTGLFTGDYHDISKTYGSSHSAKFSNAITAAVASGKPVYIPPGTWGPMSIDQEITSSVSIIGVPGRSILTYDNTDSCLELRAPYSSAYTVTAISTVTDGSASGTDDSITRLTITGGSAFAEGDSCKIYSEDSSYYAAAADKNWMGELFEVRYIDAGNSYVFVKGLLANTYTTSIKVRILTKVKVSISGVEIQINGTVTNLYDDSLTAREPAVKLWGIHEPELRQFTLRSAWGQGVNLIACWMPDIEIRGDQIINGTDSSWSPGVDALGYLITTMTCFGGHIKVHAEACRHVFTTLHPEDVTFNSSRWLEYGETIGTKISGVSINAEGAPFDTHESGINLIFENCYVYAPARGEYGAVRGKGFNTRARNTMYNNCHVIGGFLGFFVTGVDHGAKHVVRYAGCSVKRCHGTSQEAFYVETSTNAPDVFYDNCHASDSFRLFGIQGGQVFISGGSYKLKGDWFAKVYTGGALHVHGALVDYTDTTNTEQFIRLAGTCSATVTNTHIVEGSSRCTGIFYDEDGSGTKTCKHGNISSTTGTLSISATGGSTTLASTNIDTGAVKESILNIDIADGSAEATYYVVSPYAGTISKIYTVIHGVVSTADITLTGNIGATPITNGVVTIATAGSAAGDVDSATPTAANTVTAGQAINFVVTGGGAGGSPRISLQCVISRSF